MRALPAKYDSARTPLEVELRKIFAFGQVRANENRLCEFFRSQILLRQLSYIKLIDEIQRAESPKYTIAQAYERGYTFEFGSDPAGINFYLHHRFELNSDLKAFVKMIRPNISPELYAKLLNCQATSHTVENSFNMLGNLLAKDRHFFAKNVWKCLALYVNKPLE